MYIIDSPLCLRNFIGKCFQPVIVVGIKAVSAFSVPFGNDVHIPSVFGKWRLYIVPEGYFCILDMFALMVWSLRINTCAEICGRAMRRDLWSSSYSRKAGT
jgi:hypothetical protein